MSRLRSLCTKKIKESGGRKTFKSKLWIFFVFASPLFIHKKDGKLFSFPFFCTVCCFFSQTRGELKTNFLTPRQSRSSRGRKSCGSKVFRFRVVCVPLSSCLHSPSSCRYFPFRWFSLPSTCYIRGKVFCAEWRTENIHVHTRERLNENWKILAPDASECAFYLLNCNFFGTLARKCF